MNKRKFLVNKTQSSGHLCQVVIDFVLQFPNLDSRYQHGYVIRVADQIDCSVGRDMPDK